MITIIKDKNPNHIFAALKLCEQLYQDGKIPLYMFRNMVNEHADVVVTPHLLNSATHSVLTMYPAHPSVCRSQDSLLLRLLLKKASKLSKDKYSCGFSGILIAPKTT